MTKKEINEIKNLFSYEDSNIRKLCGCYVDGEKNKVARLDYTFLNLTEEERHKYLEIFRRCLTGTIGRSLIELEFNESAYNDGNSRSRLLALRESELGDEKKLEAFYDSVISSYDYVGNYLILLINQTYDIPVITNDNIGIDDASEEVFNFILCCVCPVNLSKAGLSYDEAENVFKNSDRSYMVDMPELAFLFPAFNLRSEDTDNVLFYSKSTDEFQDSFMNEILDCRLPMPANVQKETFQNIVSESLGEDCDYETIKNIHDNLSNIIDEKKSLSSPASLDKEEVKSVFERSGVASEKIKQLEESFDRHFEKEAFPEPKFEAANILPNKKLEIKTPEVVVKINSEKTDLVETTYIEGNRYLLIRIDEGLSINGIPVGGNENGTC